MKCPIKTPVKVIGSNGTIVDIEDVMVVKVLFRYPDRFELQMQQLRYAAEAINSHEKLVETLGTANKCLVRAMLKLDTSQYDHDLRIIAQALKEVEKPK